MDGYYLHTGLDHFLERLPLKFHAECMDETPLNYEGFLWVMTGDPRQVTEIRIGPSGLRILSGMYHACAALAAEGIDLIIDDVVFDSRILRAAVDALHSFKVLFVGVRCPFEIALQRETERGDRDKGLVRAHFHKVHNHGNYDLEVDTSILTPLECANRIKDRLLFGPEPDAFQRLYEAR